MLIQSRLVRRKSVTKIMSKRRLDITLQTLLVLLGALATVGDIFAQPTIEWTTAVNFGQRDWATDVVSIGTDGYFVIGITGDHKDGGDPADTTASIFKLSSGGELVWRIVLNDYVGSIYPRKVVRSMQDDILFIGGEQSRGSEAAPEYRRTAVSIVALTPTGNILWSKETPFEGISAGRSTADGGATFIVRGETSEAENPYMFTISQEGFVTRSWPIDLPTGYSVSDFQSNGNSYIVTGTASIRDAAGNSTGSTAFVMMMDEHGNRMWEQHFQPEAYTRAGRVTATPKGAYLVAGSVSSGFDISNGFAAEVDAEGNINWETVFSPDAPQEGRSILWGINSSRTTYTLVGHDFPVQGGNSSDILILSYDKRNETTEFIRLGDDRIETVADVEDVGGQELILVGEQYTVAWTTADSNTSDIFVAKLSIHAPTHAEQQESRITEKCCSLFPSPASNETTILLTVEAASSVGLALFDSRGRLIRHYSPISVSPGTHALPLSTAHLEQGVYFIHVQLTGGTTVLALAVLR